MLSLLFNCREGEGQRLTCTVFRRCLVSPGYHTIKPWPVLWIDAPDARLQNGTWRNKSLLNSKLGS